MSTQYSKEVWKHISEAALIRFNEAFKNNDLTKAKSWLQISHTADSFSRSFDPPVTSPRRGLKELINQRIDTDLVIKARMAIPAFRNLVENPISTDGEALKKKRKKRDTFKKSISTIDRYYSEEAVSRREALQKRQTRDISKRIKAKNIFSSKI